MRCRWPSLTESIGGLLVPGEVSRKAGLNIRGDFRRTSHAGSTAMPSTDVMTESASTHIESASFGQTLTATECVSGILSLRL